MIPKYPHELSPDELTTPIPDGDPEIPEDLENDNGWLPPPDCCFGPTPEEERQWADEYDYDVEAEEVARKRGLVVVFPKPNQLQLDIDSEEALRTYLIRKKLFGIDESRSGVVENITESASGLPHLHVTLTFTKRRRFTEWQRIALQAALGSDPVREYLNAARKWHGIDNPTRLFEKPPPDDSHPTPETSPGDKHHAEGSETQVIF